MKTIRKFFNRKRNIGLLALAMVFTMGLYVSNYVSKIPLHDGEVLVDSANVQEEESEKEVSSDEGATEYNSSDLKEMRATVNLDRNNLLNTLNETINNSSEEGESLKAEKQRDKLLSYIEKETEIESIIKTKKLPESLVIITDKSVNATVDKQELDQTTVSKICEIIIRQTGRSASEVVIQSVY